MDRSSSGGAGVSVEHGASMSEEVLRVSLTPTVCGMVLLAEGGGCAPRICQRRAVEGEDEMGSSRWSTTHLNDDGLVPRM